MAELTMRLKLRLGGVQGVGKAVSTVACFLLLLSWDWPGGWVAGWLAGWFGRGNDIRSLQIVACGSSW